MSALPKVLAGCTYFLLLICEVSYVDHQTCQTIFKTRTMIFNIKNTSSTTLASISVHSEIDIFAVFCLLQTTDSQRLKAAQGQPHSSSNPNVYLLFHEMNPLISNLCRSLREVRGCGTLCGLSIETRGIR